MGQFTVYRNKNARTKATFPLLVDIQADLLEDLQTRVVIPMTKAGSLTRKPLSHVAPTVTFDGEDYLLMTPLLAGIARTELGPPIGNLAATREAIVGAMDFLLTGF